MFKGGMAGMMQKAKQMQEDMKTAQEEIKLMTCEGNSASGSIKIILNGEYKVANINIDNSLLTDKEMLEDLIMLAFNDASLKVNNASKDKMKNVTGGLNLPF
ncbi:MAG: YbaB/EbfC family nucleoid-associated protein [Candidatus Thioglobus sp.]|jgi:DNA-binding YbaB/EbfC family protein|nr:YbaB/EbfC family nucleoid-associated protein [Candidatus Pseudothioglobus aerophilus]MBT3439651.1 YbaB/EbfC family nucleoid-associated protein [Gammaproteobacteria bacterium]MBT4245392.1 YbaB/EbfC family nucleoid-associated protein [Gammaproteobacteria bacterium]MBT4587348.1 YbaB/EbfC family nucleoid-associated protein [Gammaproteobacteria bacterium]MBT4974659.1 YbaB/EbfC family nucleoid-associated protein [Gammaproteobacteria bacterium]